MSTKTRVLCLAFLLLILIAAAPAQAAWKCVTYSGYSLHHQTGEAGLRGWWADLSHSAGFMSFGPYDTQYRYGPHTAMFTLGYYGSTGGSNDTLVMIDVASDSGRKVLARRYIKKSDFKNGRSVQNFSIDFDDPGSKPLETRVYYYKRGGAVEHIRSAVCGEFRWAAFPPAN